jgi:transposase
MVFSAEDRILVENLYKFKGYGPKKLIKEFPGKYWNINGLKTLLKKLRSTGTTARKPGSGRRRSVRTDENVAVVNDLVLSQEDAPKTHRTIRQIARETDVHRSTVHRIIHQDLKLKCLKKRRAQELTSANRESRLIRAKKLLRQFPAPAVDFIFFTDEKVFTVAPPINPQNDRVYVLDKTKKRDVAANRLLRTRPTFSKSLMVSVAVSKLGCSGLVFVDPGAKINGSYYRDEMLAKQLLPAIRSVAGDTFVFQQDSAPAHRARDTVAYLARETPYFIGPELWPPNSPDLNPVDYKVWGVMQEMVYRTPIRD